MNTAITSRQDTIKTMKVDKEIVACMVGGEIPARGHVYLFTEMSKDALGERQIRFSQPRRNSR